MAMLRSGIESTPRQLTITASRFPHAIARSEDAKNAYCALLRAAVLQGHRLLQAAIAADPSPSEEDTRLLALSKESVLIYSVYRAKPNQQWVNVAGKLVMLPATGACVQGGKLGRKLGGGCLVEPGHGAQARAQGRP